MKKEYRIKQSKEIESIIKTGRSKGTRYFVLYTKKHSGQSHFRYAISVSKHYGNAVMRNKMKRRMRSVIADGSFQDDIDFFVVAKPKSAELSFSEIEEQLKTLFRRANIEKKDRMI